MSINFRYKLFYCWILFATQNIYTQSPAFRHFTDEDGLPSMTVYGIAQDPNGFLWMTTSKGICRFDGQEFKNYKVPDLKGQDIPFIFMDDTGIPWFYNLVGEIIFIRNDSIFKAPIKKSSLQMVINTFYVYKEKLYLTLKSSDQMKTYCYDTRNFNNFEILNRTYSINGILNGMLIGSDLGTRENIFQLYAIPENKLLFEFPLHSNDNFNYHNEINLLAKFSPDSFALITPYFSAIFNSKFQVVKNLILPQIVADTVIYVSMINSSELFIKSNLNSFIYNLRSNTFVRDTQFGISINTIFEDSNQRRWISTTNKGLFLSLKDQVKLFTPANSGLYSNEIIRITQDYPRIFFNHNNGSISIYDQLTKKWNFVQIPGSRRIKSFIKYHLNRYFIGSDNGLYVLNLDNINKPESELLKYSSIKDLWYSNKKNELLILSGNGTFRCNHEQLFNKEYKLTPQNASITIRSTSCIQYKDTLLVGTIDGIYFWNGYHFDKWNHSLPQDYYINRLYCNDNDILWICTDGNGIFAYNNGKVIDSINVSNGLPSNSVSAITSIDNHQMVICTDNGAFIYSTVSKTGYGFNQLDGLAGKEVTDVAYSNKTIWFGTDKGVVSVSYENLNKNTEKPFLSIASAIVFSKGGEQNFKQDLPYNSNHLRFKIQTRSLISSDQLKIIYRLNNSDSNWIKADSKTLEFVGLAPGKYNLQIKAVNEDGIGSDPITVAFQINPPWWKTLWFNLIAVSLLIIITIGVTKSGQNKRRRDENKKRDIMDQMNHLRQQALQNQMNPHFIFNALNAIQSFLLVNDERNAVNYLSKFGKLIRLIFEQSKLKNISLQDEIDLLKNYIHLEELRFGNKVNVQFDVDPELMEIAPDIFIPPLLIQPIIENSFRHGLFHLEKKGLLNIQIHKNDTNLICTIEDNGIGREAARRINRWKNGSHQSSGIRSTMDRLAILDQGKNKMSLEIIDLYDSEGIASGTKAILKL